MNASRAACEGRASRVLAALRPNSREFAWPAANVLADASSLACSWRGRYDAQRKCGRRASAFAAAPDLPACSHGWEQSMSDVRSKSLGRPTLYALILVSLYLTYLVLRPFVTALAWAVTFAILFHDMQAALARRLS